MNNDIKEILDEMKQICDVWVIMEGGVKTYNQDQIHCIYDYITNLQEKLEVSQTNEETYRLEMQDITKCLGLEEDTIFDEVKEKTTNLQEENKRLKQFYDKKGVYSLEYDKETLTTMICEKQDRIDKAIEYMNKNSVGSYMELKYILNGDDE